MRIGTGTGLLLAGLLLLCSAAFVPVRAADGSLADGDGELLKVCYGDTQSVFDLGPADPAVEYLPAMNPLCDTKLVVEAGEVWLEITAREVGETTLCCVRRSGETEETVEIPLCITPRPLTITVGDAFKAYGEEPVPEKLSFAGEMLTVSGWLEGDDPALLEGYKLPTLRIDERLTAYSTELDDLTGCLGVNQDGGVMRRYYYDYQQVIPGSVAITPAVVAGDIAALLTPDISRSKGCWLKETGEICLAENNQVQWQLSGEYNALYHYSDQGGNAVLCEVEALKESLVVPGNGAVFAETYVLARADEQGRILYRTQPVTVTFSGDTVIDESGVIAFDGFCMNPRKEAGGEQTYGPYRALTVVLSGFSDAGSGLGDIRYGILSGGDIRGSLEQRSRRVRWLPGADEITIEFSGASEERYQVLLSLTDRVGNTRLLCSEIFLADAMAPSLTVGPPAGQGGRGDWYTSEVSLTLTARDAWLDTDACRLRLWIDDGLQEVTFSRLLAEPELFSRLGITCEGRLNGAEGVVELALGFADDHRYILQAEAVDRAGNEATSERVSFGMDRQQPGISVTGLKDKTTYTGQIRPLICLSDRWLDTDSCRVTLTGARSDRAALDGLYDLTVSEGKVSLQFHELSRQLADDRYRLKVTGKDMAGNQAAYTLQFSLNRRGSVFIYGKELTELLEHGIMETPSDLILTETNVDGVCCEVLLARDGSIRTLNAGEDYQVSLSRRDGWYTYTYRIYGSIFEKEGEYALYIRSEDGAGHIATTLEKAGEIRFVRKDPPENVPEQKLSAASAGAASDALQDQNPAGIASVSPGTALTPQIVEAQIREKSRFGWGLYTVLWFILPAAGFGLLLRRRH